MWPLKPAPSRPLGIARRTRLEDPTTEATLTALLALRGRFEGSG